jgi:hypothetical protein
MEEEQSGEPGRTVAKGTKAKGNDFSGHPLAPGSRRALRFARTAVGGMP